MTCHSEQIDDAESRSAAIWVVSDLSNASSDAFPLCPSKSAALGPLSVTDACLLIKVATAWVSTVQLRPKCTCPVFLGAVREL